MIPPEDVKKYFNEYIEFCRTLDENEPAPSFYTFIAERKAGDMPPFKVQPEAAEALDEMMAEGLEHFEKLGVEVVDQPTQEKVQVERKEVLTLRRRNGNLIGKYEMTRGEFLKMMNQLFDKVELCKKDGDTYRAW
jgi:hypothetical protein